ncbi:MAG: bifunctional 2-methylcitrate dehydratase/aconitate hydratase [Armatimonadetes bacterium]|nr:bifunctional 2-methylcitrate dehydratase/aconitate hydratase [Armatimonadota bacterium]
MAADQASPNQRPNPDAELFAIADFVAAGPEPTELAWETARFCLLDSLGCGMLALQYPACVRRLGPVVPGAGMVEGVRVPGTSFELDPVKAAFDIGTLVRWLDYNDTWLAAEWGHPSDNLGAILAVGDYLARRARRSGGEPVRVGALLRAMIQAHEIQGILALENSFNRVGLDHVLLVKVASTAVATRLLGGTHTQIVNALSHAWVDGQALRTYRHAPNAGPRKSWAAGDATSRAVRLALLALAGEPGIPGALSAARWGFQDVLLGGRPLRRPQEYGCYVMENVLFKVSFPAEFHAQTAAEAAIVLHPQVRHRLEEIERIELSTQEPAIRIISKTGPLHNPADRDHCLQYITAIGLLHGDVTADHYEDAAAGDPLVDRLRQQMVVQEDPRYTREYYEPECRSIANAVQVFFRDGSATEKVAVEYPIGHRRRRAEGIPLLVEKARRNLSTRFPAARTERLLALCTDAGRLDALPADEFMALWVEDSPAQAG